MSTSIRLFAGFALMLLRPAWVTAAVLEDPFTNDIASSTWETISGPPGVGGLVSDTTHVRGGTGDHSAMERTGGIFYGSQTKFGAISISPINASSTQSESLTVWMWDDNQYHDGGPPGGRIAGGIFLAPWTGSANDGFGLTINSTKTGGFSTYNWFTKSQGYVSTGIQRSMGWHKLQIEVLPYTGTNDVKFYIDDVLAGVGKRAAQGANSVFDWITIGSTIDSLSPFWYDDVNLSLVPEPSALILLAVGSLLLRRSSRDTTAS